MTYTFIMGEDNECSYELLDTQDENDFISSVEDILSEMMQTITHLHMHNYNFDSFIKQEIFKSFESFMDKTTFDHYYDLHIENCYINNGLIARSFKNEESKDCFSIDVDNKCKLEFIKSLPQPEQRTQEWYEFRQQHITGSNAWKIFHNDTSRRNLMCEKLSPPDTTSHGRSNMGNNPMNWGHKYEPITTMLYEYFNDVKVEEFGCVPHREIPFLAASPDGIVTSEKYNGRMIEIKNVVSREITQIPKMEYYIQMQIQMEVCDLDECDFVETKFVEYDSYDNYKEDENNDITRGMIMVFVENNEKYVYEYCPINHTDSIKLDAFMQECYKKYGIDVNNVNIPVSYEKTSIQWEKNIYWKLEVYSVVYVPRNRAWFEEALPLMVEFWNNVQTEKLDPEAYLKYKAKPRQPKCLIDTSLIQMPPEVERVPDEILINNFIQENPKNDVIDLTNIV